MKSLRSFGPLLLCPLFLFAGCAPTASTSQPAPTAVAVNPNVQVTRTIAFKVPDMHCPHACWPNVQETLAAEPGVGSVKLAEQKDENSIDNPVVYVDVDDKFDAEHAIAALANKGFKETEEVKN
jgi:periplasmic mercuric ion binding protein